MRTKRVIDRFSDMVKRQFGCEVEYFDLLDPKSQPDKTTLELVRRNRQAKSIIQRDDVLLPIEGDDCLYAFIRVHKGLSVGPEGLEKLQSLTELLVKSVVISESKKEILDRLENFLEERQKEKPRSYGTLKTNNDDFIGQIDMGVRQADSKVPILILSKTGAASEDLAREIHEASNAIDFKSWKDIGHQHIQSPDDLISLGNVTLFFNELSEIPIEMQASIESFLRIEAKPKRSPRIIASTVHNPKAMIEQGVLSQTFVYLLSAARITMPPLESRRDDILELIHFFSMAHSQGKMTLSSYGLETLIQLIEYGWSGNETELETEVKRLVNKGEKVKPNELDVKIVGTHYLRLKNIVDSKRRLADAVVSLETQLISESLNENGGNKSKVSRELGLSRSALHQKITDLNLG